MDSGNRSSSCKEFNSQSLFITNANNNGFSISNTTSTTTAAVATTSNSNNNNKYYFSFLDSISFLPHTSPFPILLDPPEPDSHVPAQTAPANTSSSPRSTTTTSSKKRPRPPRRAPTTVLTTDTSNFRAMVQEFTGIPSPPPPSSSSASPYRFATPSPSFLQLKPYPHNPSYHHLPPPPPPPSLNFGLSNPQLLLLQSQLAMKAQMTPSTSAAAAGYGSAADLGQQLTGVIGSGWGQAAGGVDPTSLLSQVISNGACCKLNNYSD